MGLGSIYGKHERVFLISTTHGAENHGLAAAIASIKEMQKKNVVGHLYKIGRSLKTRLNAIHKKYGLEKTLNVFGEVPCRLAMSVTPSENYSAAQVKTYLLQELISQGVLFNGYFAPSYSHGEREIRATERAWHYACAKLAVALKEKDLERKLVGEPVKPVFRRFN